MENAADALIMAGAVLVLVIVLSVSIFAFSNARQSLDNISDLTDKDYLTVEGNEDYYYVSTSNNSNVARNVGMETVIPAMYRAFYEDYKIIFNFFGDDNYCLFTDESGNKKNFIDIEDSELLKLSPKQRKEFIFAIIYHTDNIIDKSLKVEDLNKEFSEANINIRINNNDEGLIKYISKNNKTITEELGVYTDKTGQDGNKPSERRVITYTIH